LVLNKNIDNFFNENEMLAFNPGAIVPGIYYTNDKMFQTRTFAYANTQRHRLGPNYMQILVNAPKCPHYNDHTLLEAMLCGKPLLATHFDSIRRSVNVNSYRRVTMQLIVLKNTASKFMDITRSHLEFL
jgi:hypothetical protein